MASTCVGGGSYGRVFDPPIPCDDGYLPPAAGGDYLSKVYALPPLDERQAAQHEQSGAALVAQADPAARYHMPVLRKCKAGPMVVPPNWAACRLPPDGTTRVEGRWQTFVAKGTASVPQWIGLARPPEGMVWEGILHLAKGLDRLATHDLAHGDLKLSNAVLPPGLGPADPVQFRLIDFGMVRRHSQFRQAALLGDYMDIAFSDQYVAQYGSAPETALPLLFHTGAQLRSRVVYQLLERCHGRSLTVLPAGCPFGTRDHRRAQYGRLFPPGSRPGVLLDTILHLFRASSLARSNQYELGVFILAALGEAGVTWGHFTAEEQDALEAMTSIHPEERLAYDSMHHLVTTEFAAALARSRARLAPGPVPPQPPPPPPAPRQPGSSPGSSTVLYLSSGRRAAGLPPSSSSSSSSSSSASSANSAGGPAPPPPPSSSSSSLSSAVLHLSSGWGALGGPAPPPPPPPSSSFPSSSSSSLSSAVLRLSSGWGAAAAGPPPFKKSRR